MANRNRELAPIRFPEAEEQPEAAQQFLKEYNALPVLLLEPEDIADSVVFLVSPQAKYITGAVINVAAGANARDTLFKAYNVKLLLVVRAS